jgi:ribonucleoside-triphosphate reductase
MKIKKRDGRIVNFDQNKIIDAIFAAFKEIDGDISEYAYIKAGNIADYIQEQVESADHILDIEEIQDMVEKGLMSTKRKDVARAYITYRNERTAERNRNSNFMKTISEKLTAANVQNQNANVDEHSFGGRMGEANDALTKQYALDYCISDMAKANHLNNEIYIHDLGFYAVGSHNCLSIPFDKLLANGFNTRQTDVRPANSVNTAFQLVAVIFQLQSLQQFGGVSATHLDWTMVPYVRKSFYKHFKDGFKYCCNYLGGDFDLTEVIEDSDIWNSIIDVPIDASVYTEPEFSDAYNYAMDMTIRETYQAVEGMYHNLNTLQSRSGNQLPFTSINYGTCTLPEGRMVTKALLDVSREGIGKLHKTSIFPCGIFQYMKGVNDKPGTPNYDLYRLALHSTSERLYPNYANVDWSGNAGYDRDDPRTYFSTMGKRKLQLM